MFSGTFLIPDNGNTEQNYYMNPRSPQLMMSNTAMSFSHCSHTIDSQLPVYFLYTI